MWCCWFQAFWAWSLSTEGLKSLWLAKDLWLIILKSNLKPSCLWSYMRMTCCGSEQYVLPSSVNAFSHNTDCSNLIVGSIQLYLGLNMPATTAASSTWLMCPPRVRYSNGNVHVSRFFPPTRIWWDVTLLATRVTFENWIPQNSRVNQWIPTAPNTFRDCIWSCFFGL